MLSAEILSTTRRRRVGAAVINNLLYAVGGNDGSTKLKSVERYDPHRNYWAIVDSMGTKREGVSVSVLNGCLYAVGGSGESSVE
ncbi:kelch repeat protein, partial [Teladorsagia circumcincta]